MKEKYTSLLPYEVGRIEGRETSMLLRRPGGYRTLIGSILSKSLFYLD
jgi:hypothetical protein